MERRLLLLCTGDVTIQLNTFENLYLKHPPILATQLTLEPIGSR